jgi:hypothetical protein
MALTTTLHRITARMRLLLLAATLATVALLAAAGAAHAGTPYYWIVAEHSGKALMAENHNKEQGTRIVQMSTPQNWGAQHWFVERVEDFSSGQTVRRFRNRHSKLCITAQNISNGAALTQQPCEYTYHDYQRQWVVSSKSAMWAGLPWTAYNRYTSGCLDIAGAWHDDYTQAAHYWCHGQANQRFRLKYAGTTG